MLTPESHTASQRFVLSVGVMPPKTAQQHTRQDTETETKCVCPKSTALNDAVEGVMHEAPTPFQKLIAVAASIALINTKSTILDARISGITLAREHYKYLRPQKTLQVIQTLLVGSRHSQ